MSVYYRNIGISKSKLEFHFRIKGNNMIIFYDSRFFIKYKLYLKTSKSGQQASFTSKTYIYRINKLTNQNIILLKYIYTKTKSNES